MSNKLKGPQKGAFKKLTDRLKELAQRPPPAGLMEILNQTEEPKSNADKKVALPSSRSNELDA
jgi:hypothetical protein